MSDNIFLDNAPKYWAVGLPAIPLRAAQKAPAPKSWQIFGDRMPSQDEQDVWLMQYSGGNIGLPMGPSSGLVAIDIDSEDPTVLEVLEKVLPPSPWHRVGKKGSVRVYKWNGERTQRIKASDGTMIVEILSKGTQFVLPPSIHPDTMLPYTANANLYEVLDKVLPLPMDFENVLRDAFAAKGIDVSRTNKAKISVFVPAGARDNALVAHAGILARSVTRGERTLLEAIAEITHWVDNFVEQVVGDPITADKAVGKLVEFLIRDVTSERAIALPIGWDDGLTDEMKTDLGLTFTKDDEVWNADRMLEYLAEVFNREGIKPTDPMWISAVEVVLDKMAKGAGKLSMLDEDRVMRFVVAQSKNTMNVSVLKRQVSALRKGDIAGENHKEIADKVVEFISGYGELRFHVNSFWQWRGSHWEKVDNMEIQRIIQDNFGFYPACRRFQDYVAVMKACSVAVNKPLRDGVVAGLNFANGFLTDKLELVDHDPDFGCTYTLPYRYLPELAGHMPVFNQYLADSWDRDPDYSDKVLALQEAFGATLFGVAPKYQRAFCLIGQAGSGKSRIMAILQGLVPKDVYSAISPTDWGDKYLPAMLYGKLINFAGELNEYQNIPGAAFKQIVGGEEMAGQYKNMQPFTFSPQSSHWFGSNHNPKTKDSSEGFTRRWLFLEWNYKVPAHKINRNLDQEILEYEVEAIVAWAVEGFRRLRDFGDYTFPASHLVRQDQMAQDNNSVRYFLTEHARVSVGRKKNGNIEMSEAALHGEYWAFCIGTNTTPRVNMKTFHQMMKDLQEPFDFEQVVTFTPNGNPETKYRGIGFVKNVGKTDAPV